jgi:uncharacterized lipoprotein YddW (UPF0748 family)
VSPTRNLYFIPVHHSFLPICAGIIATRLVAQGAAPQYESATVTPPAVAREFRGVWVATVDNIDWPSKKDLNPAEQKAELRGIIERAARLKLNAIILQVRPQCDAIYASSLEPWSEFLTGQMGKAPAPAWDPLAFAITEAHQRGMELHAWFNPYRALHPAAKGPVAANHVSQTKPQLVRSYGKYLWLDPGEREVQDYSHAVVMDVVRRYDVDGVHFDDYFYPYPEGGAEFPDDTSWKRFGSSSGLSRNDWRRQNVNQFVQRIASSVHATKPWVKFGISPFGIWRPGHPSQIKGSDAYEMLFADARKWLREGTVDYLVPQLYWPIDQKERSFSALLQWWNEQNFKQRHVWPGLATYKLNEGWSTAEILNQIRMSSRQPVAAGHVHYSFKPWARSIGLQEALSAGPYAEPALVPACNWLNEPVPGKPNLTVTASASGRAKLTWSLPGNRVRLWLVQSRTGTEWKTAVSTAASVTFTSPPEAVAVTAIGRNGVAGPAAGLRRK